MGRKGDDDGKEGRVIHGFSVNAVDTTGARDAFNGGFATFISEGYTLDEAVYRANSVASH
ncbi:PfkB family carbohydrate kinase [Guptibacillus hwajinpoensis]|uniref:PfkB family carbohydrate kinase n=1 Tax=Guptibacillus hwajinpoensis TaxID=208199 RepID=UPI001CFE3B4D